MPFFLILILLLLPSTVSAASTLTMIPRLTDGHQRNFNPFRANSVSTTKGFIFEPLFITAAEKRYYRLADSVTFSDDLSKIKLHLRSGITWSDGQPFVAEDVVYSLNLQKDTPNLDIHHVGEKIKSVSKTGPREVTVTLKQPNTHFLTLLAHSPIVPFHQWKTVKDPETFLNPDPIGTGPFTKISSFSSQEVVQCRNPKYWQASKLAIDCIRYPKVASNEELVDRLSAGEIDWASAFIPDIDRNYAAYSPHHKYHPDVSSVVSLLFNFDNPDPNIKQVISDIRFRRAMSMAIDRELLINIAVFGQGQLVTTPSGLEPKFSSWVNPSHRDQFNYYIRYHPSASKRLLDNMNIKDKDGDGYRELPSGKPLYLSIITPKGWSDFESSAEVIKDMAATIGIKVIHSSVNFSLYEELMATADYDITLTNYPRGNSPFIYFDAAFNSEHQKKESPRYARHYFVQPKVDALLHEYKVTKSLDDKKVIIDKLEALLVRKQVTVPLYYKIDTVEYNSTRFKGWWQDDQQHGKVPPIWSNSQLRLLQTLDLSEAKHKERELDQYHPQ